MYQPHQDQREPSGCLQTLIITRLIVGILLVPIGLIAGGVVAVVVFFYLLSIHPLFALLFVIGAAAAMIAVALWESRRISRERPPGDFHS